MWLQRFCELFPLATEWYTGQRLNLALVEGDLAYARKDMRIGRREIEVVESSSGWTYPKWWPRLSTEVEETIQLPFDLRSPLSMRRAIELLLAGLKNIEVVSVVLRFLYPWEFGILSPPVTSLINLSPRLHENQVDYYLRYVSLLRDIRKKYEGLERVADVDMALWAAAHLTTDSRYDPLVREMYGDPYFQELRLENLLEGLGPHWGGNEYQRLLFARVLVKHDHLAAAPIVAKTFEATVRQLGRRLGIQEKGLTPQKDQSMLGALVSKLDDCQELAVLGVAPGVLTKCWKWRNSSVHEDNPISKRDAVSFIKAVEHLWTSSKNFSGR